MLRKAVVCDDNPSAGLERAKNLLQHRLMISEMVIRVHNQNGGKPIGGKFGIFGLTLDDLHIPKIEGLYACI